MKIQIQISHVSDQSWGPSRFGPCLVTTSSMDAADQLAPFVAQSDTPKVREAWEQAAASGEQAKIDLGCGLTLMARPHR